MNGMARELQTLFEVGCLGRLSDGQLLARFAERREEAVFEAVVRRHGPMVWGVCRRILRDHHDAEDALQSTFLVLARKAASIAHREKLGNWLYGVAYQTAMKARTTRAKRQAREVQVPGMPEPAAEPDGHRDELAERLDRELSRLPEKYRMPIILCDLEGMTHGQVASQLGWPVGTVSSRLSRGRALLASRLSRPGTTLSCGALAVLLAGESASAGMPTGLIGAMARAASLVAAGGLMSATVIPSGVATLTREVMKMMLLSKIKVASSILMATFALAAGGVGVGLTDQVQASQPGREDDLPRHVSEKLEGSRPFISRQQWEAHSIEARKPILLTANTIRQLADLAASLNCLRDEPMTCLRDTPQESNARSPGGSTARLPIPLRCPSSTATPGMF